MRVACALLLVLLSAAAARAQEPALTFRSSLDLVTVDAIVRDRVGNVVRGLTAEEFEIFEDGVRQQIVLFAFQEVAQQVAPLSAALLGDGPAGGSGPLPLRGADVAGRRLIVLLFDLSAMRADDVRRAVEGSRRMLDTQLSSADLVAVATVGWQLQVLEDFTSDPERIRAALDRIAYSDGLGPRPAVPSTMATDEAEAGVTGVDPDEPAGDTDDPGAADELTDLELFNNDLRLRALRTLAETLAAIEQRKAIVYFSGGMSRTGHDNQVELRAAVNAAVRGNIAIYPVDARGLQAIVPGGDATRQSGRGEALFSGADVIAQYDRLARSQETLVTLAADTGGRAFLETNDPAEAFTRVQHDLAAYYLIGYTSSNTTRDGRFRRIQVRVAQPGLRVETRAGYYADRDFTYTSRSDREAQLREQLAAAVSATDLPVMLATRWFRVSEAEYDVPVSVAVPGVAVAVPAGRRVVGLDLIGQVWDEQDRPIASLRQALQVPVDADLLGGAHIQYQTSLRLPPGRFRMKVVARENVNGRVGSFEVLIVVPDLSQAPFKISPVVISTHSLPAPARTADAALVRDGRQLLPNPTHIIGREQTLVVYYEVYEPVSGEDGRPLVQTSVAFYRGSERVLETPLITRTDRDGRGAVRVAIDVPASSFEPGLYTAQVTAIDALARQFAFPRVVFFVR